LKAIEKIDRAADCFQRTGFSWLSERPCQVRAWNQVHEWAFLRDKSAQGDVIMNGIIYLVGLIVVIMFILSFLGLR
jgi:hypothetical protein